MTLAVTDFGVQRLDGSSVVRTELVRPGMCGHNSQFVGQLGDWTWDAVSAVCDTNVYTARDERGAPTYLSFYYFHIRSGGRLHPLALTFGDVLRVESGVFGLGSESVHTLHRIRYADATAPSPEPIDPDRFYAYDDPDCLYVENLNRWITRSRPHSNRDLVVASPVGFRHRDLPRLPDRYSPRAVCVRARTALTFVERTPPGRVLSAPPLRLEYHVDPSRDLNGVGLLYFASYFSIVDWGLLRFWRHSGRGQAAFLRRVVRDQKMCYLGNVDADAVLCLDVAAWRRVDRPGDEIVNVVVREQGTGAPIAVSTLHLLSEDPHDPVN